MSNEYYCDVRQGYLIDAKDVANEKALSSLLDDGMAFRPYGNTTEDKILISSSEHSKRIEDVGIVKCELQNASFKTIEKDRENFRWVTGYMLPPPVYSTYIILASY